MLYISFPRILNLVTLIIPIQIMHVLLSFVQVRARKLRLKAQSYKSKRIGVVQSALIEREIPPLRQN